MKRYKKNGEDRLWFETDEIEDIVWAELSGAGLVPTLDHPVVDVEAFVESHLRIQLDSYAPLPADVIGQIEFIVGGTAIIRINRDLTGAALDDDHSEPGLLGRWRATVAHEAAHGLFHRSLFNLSPPTPSLFDEPEGDVAPPPEVPLLRCLKRNVVFRQSGSDWREVQANLGMAALLMPKLLFASAFHFEREQLRVTRIERGSPTASVLASRLAARFQVSNQAALIRLESLELLARQGQTELPA